MTFEKQSKKSDKEQLRATSWTFINIYEGDFVLAEFEDGSHLIEEWSLRRFLNVPNVINDPAFASLLSEDLLELSRPLTFLSPQPYSQQTTGFPPRLLTELCQLHLIAWEQELISPQLRELVERCAILYWHLVGGGADQHSKAIFGDVEGIDF
jgi:hypothetical protein